MAQITIVFLAALAALGHADPVATPKLKLNMREALDSIAMDMSHDLKAAREAKAHPKLKVDKWQNCGEPVAYWGEGNDRSQCPCKPDPRKTPIDQAALEDRLKLMAKSPEHKWKLNTTSDYKWKGQFYINLHTSTKRREHIEAQLKLINEKRDRTQRLPTHRWVATDYKQAARANLKEFSDEGTGDYIKKMDDREKWGTIATYLSHLRLLRRIWSNDKEGEGMYVIMEDDGTLNSKWQSLVEKALDAGDIPKDWDIIKFGYWGLTRCEDAVSNSVYEARGPMMLDDGTRKSYYNGNLGYIVRPKSIPAILAAARKQPVYDVDGVYVSLNHDISTAEDYGIKSYYLKHSLVKGGTGGQFLATDRLGTTEESH